MGLGPLSEYKAVSLKSGPVLPWPPFMRGGRSKCSLVLEPYISALEPVSCLVKIGDAFPIVRLPSSRLDLIPIFDSSPPSSPSTSSSSFWLGSPPLLSFFASPALFAYPKHSCPLSIQVEQIGLFPSHLVFLFLQVRQLCKALSAYVRKY